MSSLALTTGSAWLSRLILAGSQVYVIPILVKNLAPDEYAAQLLLASLAAWLLLGDLGIGTALQNHVAKHHAATNRTVLRYWLGRVAAVWLGLAVVIAAVSPVLSSALFSRLPALQAPGRASVFALATLLYLCNTLGTVAYKLWYAQNKGWIANSMMAASGLLTLASIHAIGLFAPSTRLMAALIITLGPQAVCGLMAFALQWTGAAKLREPTQLAIDSERRDALLLRRTALQFFGFNAMAAVVLNVDYFIISQSMRGKDIVEYGLVSRIFALFWMLYSTVLQALWPVCTRLIHEGKVQEVMRTVRQTMGIGLVALAVMTGVTTSGRVWIFSILTSGKIAPASISLLLLFSVYYAIRIWTDTFAMLLQCQNDLRTLWIFVPIQAILSTSLQVFMIARLGLPGAVLGVMASYLFTVSWALPLRARRILRTPT